MNKIIGIMVLLLTGYTVNASDKTPQMQQDTMRKPPIVKELPRDSATYRMPVQRIDTMKNNMPVVKPQNTTQPK